jgi:nucleoid DNA-binding protein
MRTRHWWGLCGLLGAGALLAALSVPARSEKPPAEETFSQRLAKAAKTSEENANRVYQALGPVIRDDLGHGKQVSVPGLGTFRVVRVEEHRDLRNGRPVVIPAVNTVEFVSEGALLDAANAAGATPAESVPPFQYVPLPGQTPGQKVGPVRTPGTRTP